MSRGFVHLHVASSFSLQYGASSPPDLVTRAVEVGQSALALTDRDGVYGAVRFARACQSAGVDPILGVDLAVADPSPPPSRSQSSRASSSSPSSEQPDRRAPAAVRGRQPVRGGQFVDPRHPRVTVLARGAVSGLPPGAGWGRICRLVTATHLRGERGRPVSSPDLIASYAGLPRAGHAPGDRQHDQAALTVLLGPDSDVGRAALGQRIERARALLARWVAILPLGAVALEVVCHDGPPSSTGSAAQARRMLHLAAEAGIPAVLTAAVRHATPGEAVTVDILDAARRLVPLDVRHLDRVSTAGHLASASAMYATALRITGEPTRARLLLEETCRLAEQCVQDPRGDMGIGAVHLPEPTALGLRPDEDPQAVLAARCRAAVTSRYGQASVAHVDQVRARLEDELAVIAALGYPTYFLTVASVVDLIKDAGVRVAARGSGAGSLVNYLLGISGVDPMELDLLMERFCTPLRAQLPDIDIDVESARRTEIYERILARFGGDRVTCVSMMDTYRVRHAIRDVGAALRLPPGEIDSIAKAFPHIRAKDATNAIAELPELRASGLDSPRLRVLFDLVERLDGLPRHIALHPCGVILSNIGLLDRTPVEASWLGFPMSQFDKDDVEALGLLKLDVLGIRMQSAMAHAVQEIERVESIAVDLDDRRDVPLDDEVTFDLIRSARTLGCFQIESPGQRELVGKFAPETFSDLIIDISLFRPGPVKSDMITPFLRARQGWAEPDLIHPTLVGALAGTCGVVVFHEQILHIISITAGVSLAEADEVRRALGSYSGQQQVEAWWRPLAASRGYAPADVQRIWEVLKAFASFGFCKAHAAAFALPTYQSAWLKAHYPAHFLAGVLTHDPGMYPKRLILDDARNSGVVILGLDVNTSDDTYRVETVDSTEPTEMMGVRGIRLSLTDVKGISGAEVQAILAARPFASLRDFWQRTGVSRPVVERMVLAGGFDSLYGLAVGGADGLGRHGKVTRRDLLLHVGELERWSRSAQPQRRPRPNALPAPELPGAAGEAERDVRRAAAAQSQAPASVVAAADRPAQLMLDLDDAPALTPATGLPEMSNVERVHAELDILGLDVSAHVVAPYAPMLNALGAVRAADVRGVRSRSEIYVAGVKVATQTPPVRSGRRVVFLTLDDSSGPVDATFFEDVQGPYAATVFHSWMLLVRGVVRRTGPQGVSLRATGAWELSGLWDAWAIGGLDAVLAAMTQADAQAHALVEAGRSYDAEVLAGAVTGAAASRSSRPVMSPVTPPADSRGGSSGGSGDGSGAHRVLVHPSGYRQSPYADVRPPGEDTKDGRRLVAPRKLWHSSPGSSGH